MARIAHGLVPELEQHGRVGAVPFCHAAPEHDGVGYGREIGVRRQAPCGRRHRLVKTGKADGVPIHDDEEVVRSRGGDIGIEQFGHAPRVVPPMAGMDADTHAIGRPILGHDAVIVTAASGTDIDRIAHGEAGETQGCSVPDQAAAGDVDAPRL